MHYPNLTALTNDRRSCLAKGPVALLLIEDAVEIGSTITRLWDIGFAQVIAFCAPDMPVPETVVRVDYDVLQQDALRTIVNAMIKAGPGLWFHYCYNAEYLFYPFCETRSIGEMVTFNMEERRDAVLTYVVDLYAGDLSAHPTAISCSDAHLDQSGYYALARKTPDGDVLERQMEFFGGLRWRFEEHVPMGKRRIDRVSVFRAVPGLEMLPDRSFSIAEYNTFACPWHNSLTSAVCSFRTAKALRRNPGSRHQIDSFVWQGSAPFNWHSQQLLDLGLMEPGQWF